MKNMSYVLSTLSRQLVKEMRYDSFCFVNQKTSSVISYHLQKTLCKRAYWDQFVTVSFNGRGNWCTRKKINNLLHATDRLSHTVVLSSIHLLSRTNHIYSEYTSQCTGFELKTLVVIGTDGIGNSNWHTIYQNIWETQW
jgi:hypothetical protein